MIPFSWQRSVFDETDFFFIRLFQRWGFKAGKGGKKKERGVFEQIAPVLTGSIHTL